MPNKSLIRLRDREMGSHSRNERLKMSRFTLNKISDYCQFNQARCDKIGHVTQYGSRYTAIAHNKDKRIEKTCDTANAAFSELVKSYNRINMCAKIFRKSSV